MKFQVPVDITRLRWLRRGPVIVAVVLSLALPATILAHTGRFTDVPHGAQFHDEVNAIAVAGITGGCGDGTAYCPDQSVRRDAMAAFMHRGFGRIATNDDSGPVNSGGDTLLAPVTINVGGTGTTSKQYVKVDAVVGVDPPNTCSAAVPCELQLRIRERASGKQSQVIENWWADSMNRSVMVSGVFEATPGNHTYQLYARFAGPNDAAADLRTTMTATTYPFLEGDAGSRDVQ